MRLSLHKLGYSTPQPGSWRLLPLRWRIGIVLGIAAMATLLVVIAVQWLVEVFAMRDALRSL
jgi:hypothetical protein